MDIVFARELSLISPQNTLSPSRHRRSDHCIRPPQDEERGGERCVERKSRENRVKREERGSFAASLHIILLKHSFPLISLRLSP